MCVRVKEKYNLPTQPLRSESSATYKPHYWCSNKLRIWHRLWPATHSCKISCCIDQDASSVLNTAATLRFTFLFSKRWFFLCCSLLLACGAYFSAEQSCCIEHLSVEKKTPEELWSQACRCRELQNLLSTVLWVRVIFYRWSLLLFYVVNYWYMYFYLLCNRLDSFFSETTFPDQSDFDYGESYTIVIQIIKSIMFNVRNVYIFLLQYGLNSTWNDMSLLNLLLFGFLLCRLWDTADDRSNSSSCYVCLWHFNSLE